MDYLPIQYFSNKWDISKRRIQILCKEGRIEGAKMIGNMWVIPENAKRPADARVKNPVSSKEIEISSVRRELKKILKRLFRRADEVGITKSAQKTYVLAAVANGLCLCYLDEKNPKDDIYQTIYKDISGMDTVLNMDKELMDLVMKFINHYKEDPEIDNILSWAYQYSNKITKNNEYSQTQFFTEKYMIDYLVNSMYRLNNVDKIVDPCLGGGNFLVECMEYICNEAVNNIQQQIVLSAGKLYGYDIDSDITNIAVVNIRLRALSILKRKGVKFTFDIWNQVCPKIYKTKKNDKICGSLAVDNRILIDIISGEEVGLNNALGNADVVLTNPPFASIKGMRQEQKNFLKTYYPETNCDTCVAFLEAIYKMLKPKGICGIVSQNVWMHLKTFKKAREKFTAEYTIYKIVNLGSGAFFDLSGEKSNVSLLVIGKNRVKNNMINVLNLNTYSLKEKINAVEEEINYIKIAQDDIDGSNGYDFTEKGTLKAISLSKELYKDIAVPMQGTSTGNAKELVGYFWEHFGDGEWINVSNGGGYCRWQGLNDSVVKWGKSGEYIKAQRGSALRNVKYFPETQMVFSDTGTAGLNVRVLLNNQIFIASGPGIRVIKGNEYAHLAFLNSRMASYYVRIMSPKLTIAAGYIGQIPVKERVYSSVVLEKNARLCVELKQKMLSTRPNNLEYDPSFIENIPNNLDMAAWSLLNEDITNELLKLEIESKIERYIFKEYGFSKEDEAQLDKSVGKCAYLIDGAQDIDLIKLDKYMNKLLDASCCLKRTRSSKNSLGSDGIIEFIAKDLIINPEIVVKKIQENPNMMANVLKKYREMLLHDSVLYCLGYNTESGVGVINYAVKDVVSYLTDRFGETLEYEKWIDESFNAVHGEIFKGVPYLIYKKGVICRYDHRTTG